MVSAVVRRPTPLGLKDALADVAVDRGVRRVLVLGRDMPQKRVLRRERDAALVTVRRRVDIPDVHHHLRQFYKCIPHFTPDLYSLVLGYVRWLPLDTVSTSDSRHRQTIVYEQAIRGRLEKRVKCLTDSRILFLRQFQVSFWLRGKST